MVRSILYLATLVAIFFVASFNSAARPAGSHLFGLSNYSRNMMRVTESEDASPDFLGNTDLQILLQYRYFYQLTDTILIMPRIGYSIIPRENRDGAAKTSLLMLSVPVTQPFSENWEWSYGASYIQQTIKGNGGTVVLNNGNETATFYRPTGTSVSNYFSVDFGISKNFGAFQVDLELILVSLLTERRSYNLLLSFGYQPSGWGVQ